MLFNVSSNDHNILWILLRLSTIVKSLLDVDATSSNLCPYGKGLQGHLVSEIEWIILLTHNGVLNPGPHVALPAPDAQPVLHSSLTTAQTSAYNALWNAWQVICQYRISQ